MVPVPSAHGALRGHGGTGSIRVLIVEDEDHLRKSLAVSLAMAGYQTASAANGTQALRFFQESRADVVITDIFMPEMDGLQVVTAIKEFHPGVKIIAMSGGGAYLQGGDYLRLAQKLGADRILNKPVSVDQLKTVIGELTEADQGEARAATA